MLNTFFALMLFAPPTGGQTPNQSWQLVFPVLMFVVFYLFVLLPQQKQKKSKEQLLDSIKRGDKVVTIGGIHGTVAGIETDKKTVLVQVADNVKIKFERSAIANIEKQETGDKLAAKE